MRCSFDSLNVFVAEIMRLEGWQFNQAIMDEFLRGYIIRFLFGVADFRKQIDGI